MPINVPWKWQGPFDRRTIHTPPTNTTAPNRWKSNHDLNFWPEVFFVGRKNTSIPETPRPTIYKLINGCWLFLFDVGCQIFLEEMVGNHQTSIFKWVFGAPGYNILPQSSWWNRRFIIRLFKHEKQFQPWKLSNKYVGNEFVALLVQTTSDHLM